MSSAGAGRQAAGRGRAGTAAVPCLVRCARYSMFPAGPVIGDGVTAAGVSPDRAAAASASSTTEACTAEIGRAHV